MNRVRIYFIIDFIHGHIQEFATRSIILRPNYLLKGWVTIGTLF